MTLGGSKPKEIRDTLNISRGAIRSTLSLEQLREHGEAQLRSGQLLELDCRTGRVGSVVRRSDPTRPVHRLGATDLHRPTINR
jgi:hypothetical protein